MGLYPSAIEGFDFCRRVCRICLLPHQAVQLVFVENRGPFESTCGRTFLIAIARSAEAGHING
jgi:hypothetical protein